MHSQSLPLEPHQSSPLSQSTQGPLMMEVDHQATSLLYLHCLEPHLILPLRHFSSAKQVQQNIKVGGLESRTSPHVIPSPQMY
ncbi:hypothetical protein IC582_015791 [Cucumis melo]